MDFDACFDDNINTQEQQRKPKKQKKEKKAKKQKKAKKKKASDQNGLFPETSNPQEKSLPFGTFGDDDNLAGQHTDVLRNDAKSLSAARSVKSLGARSTKTHKSAGSSKTSGTGETPLQDNRSVMDPSSGVDETEASNKKKESKKQREESSNSGSEEAGKKKARRASKKKKSMKKDRSAKFHQQQLQLLDQAIDQEQKPSAKDANGSGSNLSVTGDTIISDITFDTQQEFGMIHRFASAQQQQQSQPAAQRRMPPSAYNNRPARQRRNRAPQPSSGLMAKAAILEDYEYDQEYGSDEDAPRAAPPRAELDPWEMLADEHDDPAMRQVMMNRSAQHPPQVEEKKPAAKFANGKAMPESETENYNLLLQYLQSMGADLESAKQIAAGFTEQQMKAKVGTIASLPPESPGRSYSRSMNHESPGAAPVNRPRDTGTNSDLFAARQESAPKADMPPNGVPALTAELIEAKAISMIDIETGMGNDSDFIYAESSPLEMKDVLHEGPMRRIIAITCCVIVVIVVICLSVLLTRDDPSSEGGSSQTTPPTLSPTIISSEFLDAAVSFSGQEALDTPGSPQRRAVGWLSTFDNSGVDPTDARFVQRYSLVVTYYATGGGETWLSEENWLNPDLHECDWSASSIECEEDLSRSRIIKILDLSSAGLAGMLPIELGELSELVQLKVSTNELQGKIPPQLFRLVKLMKLEMSVNDFTGAIPTEISSLVDLDEIDLSANRLSGSIPEELYNLRNLRRLDISQNLLTGVITSGLGNLSVLVSFNVRSNLIGGGIPDSFDTVPMLDFILLDDNLLTGGLPEWSGDLVSRQELTLSRNLLTGTIPGAPPTDLGSVGGTGEEAFRLRKVDISYNQFVGTIPLLAGLLPSLRYMDMSGNSFTGNFPATEGSGLWAGIEFLAARENQLEGPVPWAFPKTSLSHLDLANNKFTFQLPSQFGDFPNLEFLSLSNNQLSSTIPTEVSNMKSLKTFQVHDCSLVGTLSVDFVSNPLEVFDVGGNSLTGTVHTQFGSIPSLKKLSLEENVLIGPIPTQLGFLEVLDTLLMNDNGLTGTIPPQLGLLNSLSQFTVANNNLEGSVPPGLCSLLPDLSVEDIGCSVECSCCADTTNTCGRM